MHDHVTAIPAALLAWYDRHRRTLPWRAAPGMSADPYRVWISEIMLQQTVAATVIPYFERFVSRWPTIEALAKAPLDDVLVEWAGLGYYARARNLHRCASEVVDRFGGVMPADAESLLSLPGIGHYTAGAIASIAYGRQTAAVDGNVERVVSRLGYVLTPLPAARPELRRLAVSLVPVDRPGDFAQAMMDLGATVCVPAAPRCMACPLAFACEAYRHNDAARLPLKAAKPVKPMRYGRVYWLVDRNGSVLVRQRPATGLLGGMMEFPSSPWGQAPDTGFSGAPLPAEWSLVEGVIRHTFTHFHLELDMAVARLSYIGPAGAGSWVHPSGFDRIALPGVMHKVARHAHAKAS